MEGRTVSEKDSRRERFARAVTVLMVIALWTLAVTSSGITAAAAGEDKEAGSEYVAENEYPNIIRFHVIANSDSEQDQELKLAVRDYVLPLIEKELADKTAKAKSEAETELKENECEEGEPQMQISPSESEQAAITREYISANLERIKKWAADYVHSQGFDYEIKTELGVRAIPARQYDELYFPAGNYEALTITIGEGEGQNWWCVVFPPLCMIDAEDSSYRETLGDEAGSRIVLKSKIKMLLQQRA